MFMTALSYFGILVLTCMALVVVNATVRSLVKVWSGGDER